MTKRKSKKTYTVGDVVAAMQAWAPEGLAYSWDRVGLHTGSSDQPVSKVLTALTISNATLKAAKRQKADMIVAHHPLIWEPITHLRDDDPKTRMYMDIVESGIACYGCHTNLDIVENGVNRILADRLGLRNTAPLFPAPHTNLMKLTTFVPETHIGIVQQATAEAGAGVIGNYTHCGYHLSGTGTFMPNDAADPYSGRANRMSYESEIRFETTVSPARTSDVIAALKSSHPYEEAAYDLVQLDVPDPRYALGLIGEMEESITLNTFATQVREALGIEHVRVTGREKAKVKRIAVMGGAGGDSALKVAGRADVFVTGDVTYHTALDALDAGLNVIDAGHHGTEKWIAPAIADKLRSDCPGLSIKDYMESDPFRVV